MKTKKLIELLQKEDPSGELEICLDTEEGLCDIFHVEFPYDGYAPYEVMIRDWSKDCYNVIGAEYRCDGKMSFLRAISISEALMDNNDLPVTVHGRDKEEISHMKDKVAAWREESRKIKKDIMDPMLVRLLEKLKNGHKIFQKKTDPIGKFWKMHWDKIEDNEYGQPKQGLVSGENTLVLESGFFKPVDKGDVIEWEFTLTDGYRRKNEN